MKVSQITRLAVRHQRRTRKEMSLALSRCGGDPAMLHRLLWSYGWRRMGRHGALVEGGTFVFSLVIFTLCGILFGLALADSIGMTSVIGMFSGSTYCDVSTYEGVETLTCQFQSGEVLP